MTYCIYLTTLTEFFSLSAYPVIGVATADHGPHIDLAQVFKPDALPDTTGLGTGTQRYFWTVWGFSILSRDMTYGQEESGLERPTLEPMGEHSTN